MRAVRCAAERTSGLSGDDTTTGRPRSDISLMFKCSGMSPGKAGTGETDVRLLISIPTGTGDDFNSVLHESDAQAMDFRLYF